MSEHLRQAVSVLRALLPETLSPQLEMAIRAATTADDAESSAQSAVELVRALRADRDPAARRALGLLAASLPERSHKGLRDPRRLTPPPRAG